MPQPEGGRDSAVFWPSYPPCSSGRLPDDAIDGLPATPKLLGYGYGSGPEGPAIELEDIHGLESELASHRCDQFRSSLGRDRRPAWSVLTDHCAKLFRLRFVLPWTSLVPSPYTRPIARIAQR